MAELGLEDLIEIVFSSATIGYEKPHPERSGSPCVGSVTSLPAGMIEDNPVADVAGAQALGIPAVLVRSAGAPSLATPSGRSRQSPKIDSP